MVLFIIRLFWVHFGVILCTLCEISDDEIFKRLLPPHVFLSNFNQTLQKASNSGNTGYNFISGELPILKVYAAPQLPQGYISAIWENVKQTVKAPEPLVIIVIADIGTCIMMDIMNRNTMTIVLLSLLLLLLMLLIFLLA